jgi:hypothetical protein
VTAILAAYAAGQAAETAVLAAIAAARLLVPVVAVLAEANSDGTEKETEMALPTLIGNDGRKAVIAFTGVETVTRWRQDARPVPVPAARLWPAVAAEDADAVVVDVAGPVPLVIEGARLRALAAGEPVPPPHADPDIHAQVAAAAARFDLRRGGGKAAFIPAPGGGNVDFGPEPGGERADFGLGPGGEHADLTVTLRAADPDQARAVAEAIAASLAPRLRRGVAFRLG